MNKLLLRLLPVFLLTLFAQLGNSQTNPTAQSLPYSQNFSSFTGSTTTYPAGLQGWTISGSLATTYPTTAPSADQALAAGNNATSTAGVYDFNGKIGLVSTGSNMKAVVLAINTTSLSNIQVSYIAATQAQLSAGRINELGLQYRLGTSGTFTNVTGSGYQNNATSTINSGTASSNASTITVTLPSAADNQSVVQLRWVIRDVSGSGNRPTFSIDDIAVASSTTPTVTNSQSSLTGFTYVTGGGPSASQNFTITGSSLTNSVVITPANTNFEISTDNITFQTTAITLTSAATVSQIIYTRLVSGLSIASYTGSLTVSSTGATSATTTLSGSVTNTPSISTSTTSLSGFSTTVGTASANQSFTVSGSSLGANAVVTAPTDYEVSLTSGSGYAASVSIVPSSGTISGVSVFVRIKASAAAGTPSGNVTVVSGSASANVAVSGTVTAVPTLVVTPTTLGGFSTIQGTASTSQSFSLSGSGLTAAASITVSAGNYEVSLDNITFAGSQSITPTSGAIASTTVYVRIAASAPGGAAAGNVQVTSTGATTQNVALSGTVTGPTISSTPTSLSGFTTTTGTASASQSISVSGSSLSANITVTPSTGLEVSTDNITFGSSASLTQSGGTVSATTVYVRVAASASAGAISGTVALTSTNATTVNVTVSGFVNAVATSFTAGNVVIARLGDGTGALANTGNPVFLDEYSPSGTLVNTIQLPSTNSSGNNLVISGSATSEGALTRSADGKSLAIAGYNKSLPNATNLSGSASSTINRVAGIISYTGSVDLSTSLSDAATGNNVRSAYTTDGTAIYIAGGAGGIRYTTLGSSTSTQLSTTSANIRTINVAENGSNAAQLFVGTSSGSLRIATVGTGLPTTTGNTITNLTGFPTTGSPYQFFFADENAAIAGVDVLYVADDAAGIQKYSLVSGNWTANGTTGTGTDNYRGLTGLVDNSTSPASVTLYATASNGTTSKLVKIVDATGYNASFSSPTTTTLASSSSSNIAYRGIALSPFNSTAANNTFVGNLSANFSLAQNYGSQTAPTASTNAIIPSLTAGAMHTPVVTGTSNTVQDLTINSSANLKLASGAALNISGTLTNNGTFNTTAGDLSFNGASGTQQVPATTVNNLTLNGNAFSLSGNVTVNGTLTFTAGIVTGNGNKITVTNNAPTAVSGGSSTSYLSGGTLERVQNSTSSSVYFYPVGAASRFRPVRLTNGSVAGGNTFDVTYFATSYPTLAASNGSYHVSSTEYWDISRVAGATSDPIDVSLITDNNTASGIATPASVEVGHFNGTNWDALGNNSGNTSFSASGSEIVTTGVTTFSPFTFVSASSSNPLPIHIESFTAAKAGKNVLLRWKLGAIKAGEQVMLQKSVDGSDYHDLSSASPVNQYTDLAPANGLNFYRLKLVAGDGATTYSQVLNVSFSAEGSISVYPNPATSTLFVSSNLGNNLHCELLSATGNLVLAQDFEGSGVHAISVSNLPAGNYWMSLNCGSEQHRLQVTVLR